MRTRPPLGYSRPASSRSSVVLPQPLGPSSTMNSPSAISRSTLSTATVLSKTLLSPSRRISATAQHPPLASHAAPKAEQVTADDEDHYQRRRQHEPGRREAERQRGGVQRRQHQRRQGALPQGQDHGREHLVPRQHEGEDGRGGQPRQRQR